MSQFFIRFADQPAAREGAIPGGRWLAGFKAAARAETRVEGAVEIATLPRSDRPSPAFEKLAVPDCWLCWAGSWFHPAVPDGDGKVLLELLIKQGVERVARDLDGPFVLVFGLTQARRWHVVTDRCGTLHAFFARSAGGLLLSTSSASLAAATNARIDPSGLHQFVATGVVFGERTLWQGVDKLPAATVTTIEDGRIARTRYWSFAELEPERLPLDQAAAAVGEGLTGVAKDLARRFRQPVCDLTGGYDSRATLLGFLAAGNAVDVTVNGPEGSADVRVSKEIAARFGLRHIHTQEADEPAFDALLAAVRLTDGEADAFQSARVRAVHRTLARTHGLSVNGSFGELARGYWWELLWPRVGARRPLDVGEVVTRRFAAQPYDASLFAGEGRIDLRAALTDVGRAAVADIARLPNTTQLDCLYYSLRMQRWQGRIASASDQIWPAVSPFSFRRVLVPVLEARAAARWGSRLVRRMLELRRPDLARIPLEHGYPAELVRLGNVHRFAPLGRYYLERVVHKLRAKTGVGDSSATQGREGSSQSARQRFAALFAQSPLGEWLAAPALARTGLFDEQRLRAWIDPDGREWQRLPELWQRLVTLEALIRTVGELRRAMADIAVEPAGDGSRPAFDRRAGG